MEDLCTGWNPRRGSVLAIVLAFGGPFLESESGIKAENDGILLVFPLFFLFRLLLLCVSPLVVPLKVLSTSSAIVVIIAAAGLRARRGPRVAVTVKVLVARMR